MNNNQYNELRYNRMKQWSRLMLGLHQLINYPIMNLIWVIFAVGVRFLVIVVRKVISNIGMYPLITPVFIFCMKVFLIIFPVLCAIGIIQFIGVLTAMKDEADMSIVFGDRRDIKNQMPILIYKKTNTKTGVTKREFYTTICMERWQEMSASICDILDIHLIGDISYGGKKRNKGNYVYFESTKGRTPTKRGNLYDEEF